MTRHASKGWYLTAFKVIDRNNSAASTGTVRMSFSTKKPFNPFYVPSTNIQVDRKGTLRVYFVSVGDYDANIGMTGTWQTPEWTAAIPDDKADQLAKQAELPEDAVPDNAQVEEFVDNDFPRPAADDIYFVKKKPVVSPKAPVTPTRPVPVFAMLPMISGMGLIGFARRRRYVE